MEYNKRLYESLETISQKFNDLNRQLETATIPLEQLKDINKQLKRNKPIVDLFHLYKTAIKTAEANEEALSGNELDSELSELAKQELEEIKTQIPQWEERFKLLLLPVDPNNDKNVIIEMRPAAGGDEASIFVADLFDTYKRYADKQKWKIKIMDISTNAHGYDYVFFNITGEDVYSKMKFESGVHRVQRVPATESKGRVHTSTITVAVMPEFDEIDFKINPTDLRIDKYRAGGAGGQHVNRTDSAVRITHIPTGVVVACSQERSQIENREMAMKLLLSRIWDKLETERIDAIASMRKNQVGTGDRSEKIRTYNYPQNRITDHRIGLTLNKLDQIMQGNLDEVIDALTANEQVKLMSELKI
ncbi:MAG: peptide chain release factor 1 [Mycoplasmataceae bacterium]|nr:peptide chain release factor 1 [Mycoplasmataceae bacterium]